jgi:hypothetical protein
MNLHFFLYTTLSLEVIFYELVGLDRAVFTT